MKSPLCERLGIEFPIFAFSHCRDVVAAVSRAGGLGVLGAVAYSPEELELELRWIDEHVAGRPYGVDTVIPAAYVGKQQGDLQKGALEDMVPEAQRRFVEQLLERHGVPGLPEGVDSTESLLGWTASKGMAHVEVALQHPIALIANALGPPPPEAIEAAHAKGVAIAALCGSVSQAQRQAAAGVDVVIASGYEAGGHTGSIASMVLVPQVADAVAPIPVLAAGGVACGRQMAAAMALGAQGVWTGSMWLTTAESDCPPPLIEKLLAARSQDTVRSRCISGKPARQLITPYTEAWDGDESPGTLPMPLQWMATAEATQRIYRHAKAGGSADLLGSPVGQVVGQMNAVRSVSSVMSEMIHEYIEVVSRSAAALAFDDED